MIHGNRPARAAAQSRLFAVLGVLVVAFAAVVLASGAAYLEFQMPWKSIVTIAAVAAIAGFYRLRG